jgi:hypothetical protein
MDQEFRYLCLSDFVNRVNAKFAGAPSYQAIHRRIQAGAIRAIRLGPIYVLHQNEIDRVGELFGLRPIEAAEPAEPPPAAVANPPETRTAA